MASRKQLFTIERLAAALALALTSLFCGVGVAEEPVELKDERPNIVLMMVDDMGFSDIGCYGGEVDTPNLDALARSGLRYTQFYNCAKCETTRATLLSGRYYPEVNNTEMSDCVTIAEALKLGGYRTLMTGKWHVKSTPIKRGFDRYFGHLSGACNFFTGDDTFRLDEKPFEVPSEGFYTTDANTDYAMQFLDEWKSDHADQPFFLYIAFNAPHYPLQAPESDVRKYIGTYKIGWDQLRQQRFARQKEIGLFPQDMKLAPRPADVPAWDEIPKADRDHHDLMMATFAGMIDRVDQNIGRLLAKLDQMGVRDNTVIMFLDDNGACPFQRSKKPSIDGQLKPWDPDSYWCYDKRWAHACNTPFREYKQNQHEGGITSPMIVNWPEKIGKNQAIAGSFVRQPSHLVDIMATCLDLAKTDYPKTYQGKPVGPPRGISLQPHMLGQTRPDHKMIFFSFYGKNNAIRSGDWKLVNINFGEFELYNIANDRTELDDLSKKNPTKFAEMMAMWKQNSKSVGLKVKRKNGQKSKSQKSNGK
ncbi:MAG: arylsulfatase [Planctomycetota bacterium]